MRIGCEIKRGKDAAIHGNQVGRELNHDLRAGGEGELFLDF